MQTISCNITRQPLYKVHSSLTRVCVCVCPHPFSPSIGLVNLVTGEKQQPWWSHGTYLQYLLDAGVALPPFLRCKEYLYGKKYNVFRDRHAFHGDFHEDDYCHAVTVLHCLMRRGQYEEAAEILALDDPNGQGISDAFLGVLYNAAKDAGPDALLLAESLRWHCRFLISLHNPGFQLLSSLSI